MEGTIQKKVLNQDTSLGWMSGDAVNRLQDKSIGRALIQQV